MDPLHVRSRRSVIAGGLAVLGGAAVSRLATPEVARAADGDPVRLGGDGTANAATAPTVVANSTNQGTALEGDANSNGTGVVGRAGQEPDPQTDIQEVGVYGFSETFRGVLGVGGVTGVSAHGDLYGVYATGRIALVGDAGTADTGVYGWTGAAGPPPVPGGIGVQASAQAGLTALNVDGRVKFSRSGRTTIASGASSKVVALAGVTTASYVVATLQTNRAGVWIQAVVPAAGKFTVYLNKATLGAAVVGYFVIN